MKIHSLKNHEIMICELTERDFWQCPYKTYGPYFHLYLALLLNTFDQTTKNPSTRCERGLGMLVHLVHLISVSLKLLHDILKELLL